MSTSKIIACLLGLMLVITLAGCGHEDFPKASIEPVNGFSLGSVKVSPLKNPTAQQLYDAVIKLYSSFNSVSATYQSDKLSNDEWTMDDNGKITIIKEPISIPTAEYRYVAPSKELIKIEGQPRMTRVQNGSSVLTARPDSKEYRENTAAPQAVQNILPLWFSMLTSSLNPGEDIVVPRSVLKMSLLPDDKVNGTDVYVLEMRLPPAEYGVGELSPQVRRFYIGKQDLLIRRIDIIDQTMSSSSRGDIGKLDRTTFLGFKCNTNIPDKLFSTQPPAGWKQFVPPKPPGPPPGVLPKNMKLPNAPPIPGAKPKGTALPNPTPTSTIKQ